MMNRKKFLLQSNKHKLLVLILLFSIGATKLYSQTTIGVAPGESIQILRQPIISILPVTNVTISILGEDSLYVAGTVDSFTIIAGALRIKTYCTLYVSMTAPFRELSIQVLLIYNAGDVLTQKVYEDFLIDTSVQPSIIANFTADPIAGSAPLKVSFNNESTGYIIGYFWDFGDETTSSEQNPQHTYLEPGKYSVSLTVFNFNVQNQITKQDYINVQDATSLENYESIKPHEIYLGQNYPNPFNSQTTLSFQLKKQSEISITIFNLKGQMVTEIFNGIREPGYHLINWNADNMSAGMYIINMEAENFIGVKKCLILK